MRTAQRSSPRLLLGKQRNLDVSTKKTGAQLGFYYRNNVKAWMTIVLYQEWIRQWDEELGRQKRKIVLFQFLWPRPTI
jgi:hypothetical protein